MILQDANARGVVTNFEKAEYLFKDVPSSEVPVVFCVDKKEDLDDVARQPTCCVPETIRKDLHSEGLIYIIYTSGSTGKPKVIYSFFVSGNDKLLNIFYRASGYVIEV